MGGDALAVGVLGPFTVSVDGRPVEVSSPKLRALLVVLAVEANSPVSVDRLAEALWDDDRPEFLRRSLQTHLTRLRSILGPRWIVTESAGYRLRIEPDHVDALRFARLLNAAADASDRATEHALLVAALELWRGHPFEGVSAGRLDGLGAQLVERYLGAVERHVDLELAEGRHAALLAQLRELTATYPLREPLWVRLLAALHGSGRRAEALASYESVRQRLAEDLGVDPGLALRGIHAALLSEESEPADRERSLVHRAGSPAGRTGPGVGPRAPQQVLEPAACADDDAVPHPPHVVPRQLPADIEGFTGRGPALKALHGLLGDVSASRVGAVVISAIGGMAGIGKTALTVHWAHRLADRFPDGQLYVNLRGFDPSGSAMTSAEAVRGFLDALGAPPHRIPTEHDAQVGLYRSLLSGRRMLVVLDNARDADQVRPLLPGSPTCLVLVTSRNRLTGLVATEAARPLVLDLLPDDESRDLLAARLGPERISNEREAVDAIVARCAGLPLALSIVAARVATSSLTLAAVAAELEDEHLTLDTLDAGDPAADMRVVFSWSYRTLSPAAARLFRLLGLHPGPDLSTAAAASLAGDAVTRTRRRLAELCGANLLTEHTPGRYILHDLLRSYATELAHSDHPDPGTGATDRRSAAHRLLDHYLHTANSAGMLIAPLRHRVTIAPPQPGVTLDRLADGEQAVAWCTAEHQVLLGVVAYAATNGFEAHAWQLAWALSEYLYRLGYWYDWRATYATALTAAGRIHDRHAEAIAHRGLAMACSNLGLHTEAEPHFRAALTLFTELDDVTGQAHTHLNLGALLARQHRHADALRHCQSALDLYSPAGDRRGQAMTLNTMGIQHAELGHHRQALALCQRAATLYDQIGDRDGLAATWDSVGYIHHHNGRHGHAIRHYRRATALFHDLGHRFFEAETLGRLGDTYLAAGDADAARAAWKQARDLFDESGHPQAGTIGAKLATVS